MTLSSTPPNPIEGVLQHPAKRATERPSPRAFPAAASEDRSSGVKGIVLYGGYDADGVKLTDTWMLDCDNASGGWADQNTSPTNGPSSGHSMTVAFGIGPHQSIPNPGYWWIDIDAGVDCTLVNAPGEIYAFDETDFGPRDRFSSHVHTPWVGAGSRLRYTYHSTRSKLYGVAYSGVDPTEAGAPAKSDLRWQSTKGPSGRVGTVSGDGMAYVASAGPADLTFDLDYQGANPLNTVVVLEVDF